MNKQVRIMAKESLILLRALHKFYTLHPDRWASGNWATTRATTRATTEPTHWGNPDAWSFCPLGYIRRYHSARTKLSGRILGRAQYFLNRAASEFYGDTIDIITFNDYNSTTFEDIMKVVGRAIELAEKEAKGIFD